MRTFVTIFWNHISSIFFPLPFPLISHSAIATKVVSNILDVNFSITLDVNMDTRGVGRRNKCHTCIYPLEKSILGVLRLPFPAVARVKVLCQELHLLLQNLLHSAVRNALGIHQNGLPHGVGVHVSLHATRTVRSVVLVRVRFQVLCVAVAIRLARMCVIAAAAPTQTISKDSPVTKMRRTQNTMLAPLRN